MAAITVMTLNVYNDSSSPPGEGGLPGWMARRPLVAATIRDHEPDVVGLQEVYPWQLEYLLAELPSYECVGRGRDARGVDEAVPILFRGDRFDLVDSGHFWLSESPHTPGSTGGKLWGEMDVPRMVTWVRLRDRTRGGSFYVYNTHLASDHDGGEQSRVMSARLIAERMATRAVPTDYFFLIGDFNAPEGEFPVRYLTGDVPCSGPGCPRPTQRAPVRTIDAWRAMHAGRGGTRCSNDPGADDGERFDYILVWDPEPRPASGELPGLEIPRPTVRDAAILRPGGGCASDHCAVMATVEIPPAAATGRPARRPTEFAAD